MLNEIDKNYEGLPNGALAYALAESLSIDWELAYRVIISSDKDLGRNYAIKHLRQRDKYKQAFDRITENRKEIRKSI